MRQFNSALESSNDKYTISSDWLQGRTAFGGLAAAIALKEIQARVPNERVPLSLNIEFMAPIPPGVISSSSTVIRAGKYLTQAKTTLLVGEAPALSMQAVLGAPRATSFEASYSGTSLSCSFEDARPFDSKTHPGFPSFLQHFDLRFTESGLPFTGDGNGSIGGLCKHQSQALGYPALIALLDAWPPTPLPTFTKPIPASTVHWNIHFHSPNLNDIDFSESYCEYQAQTLAAQHGQVTSEATLSLHHQVLASARQLVAIFE